MKVEFWLEDSGKKILEVWTDSISQIPEFNDVVILPIDDGPIGAEPLKKRFKVKTREFYVVAARFDRVQVGVVEE